MKRTTTTLVIAMIAALAVASPASAEPDPQPDHAGWSNAPFEPVADSDPESEPDPAPRVFSTPVLTAEQARRALLTRYQSAAASRVRTSEESEVDCDSHSASCSRSFQSCAANQNRMLEVTISRAPAMYDQTDWKRGIIDLTEPDKADAWKPYRESATMFTYADHSYGYRNAGRMVVRLGSDTASYYVQAACWFENRENMALAYNCALRTAKAQLAQVQLQVQ